MLPVYGIVSDGNTWVFLCLHGDGRTYSCSKVLFVSYASSAEDPAQTIVEGADVVFKYLYSIVKAQVDLLQEDEENQPAGKRLRLELNPDTAAQSLVTQPPL